MEEYTIYNAENAKIVTNVPNAEWRSVKVHTILDRPFEIHICTHSTKVFAKQSGKLDCPHRDQYCTKSYGYHNNDGFHRLFKSSWHCNDLPENRILDVTNILVPGKIAGMFELKSLNKTIMPVGTQIMGWQRYIITSMEWPWIVLYAKQDDRDYLKICPDIFACTSSGCNKIPGYHNRQFESLFGGKKGHCSDVCPKTIIDITGLVKKMITF
jgi:hypothetical protein